MNPYQKLAEIKRLLRQEWVNEEGHNMIDDPYYELEGVIQDIKHGHADDVCVNTLQRVQKKLVEISRLVNEPITWETSPLTTNISEGFDKLKGKE